MRHAEGRLLVQRAVGGNYMISTMRKSQHPNIVCSIHRIHQCFGDCFFTVSQKYISCVHIHILYYIIKSYQMYDYVSLYIDKWHNMSRGPSTCQPSRFNCLVNNCIVSLRCHPTWLIGKSSIKQMEVSIGKSKIIYIYIYVGRSIAMFHRRVKPINIIRHREEVMPCQPPWHFFPAGHWLSLTWFDHLQRSDLAGGMWASNSARQVSQITGSCRMVTCVNHCECDFV